ncbi:MAG: GNAT family N-acetyltransferase [Pseudomonadota bacterium]
MGLLDRPLWNALTTRWAAFAEGDARAWRLRRDYGMFGVPADHSAESLTALAALVPDNGELWVVDGTACPAPAGTRLLHPPEAVVQMVCERPTPAPPPAFEIIDLTEIDGTAMFDLATLTRPGPYVRHTNRLGRFVGVKQGDRLVAMVGERMRMPGLAEVSGVCTHPDHRGKGYAAALIRVVMARMVAKGETAFLHASASNAGAIAVYERLGFRHRATMAACVLVRDI